MYDQAKILRGLMERRHEDPGNEPDVASGRARTIAVTSGKGGVGKSNVALNLAIALARSGVSVCVLDANPGLGSIDLLCGLSAYWNLSHVATGARALSDILLEGPAGIRIVPGAGGLLDLADCPPAAQRDVFAQFDQLEQQYEYLVVDAGAGIHTAVRQFVAAADAALLLTTPEPTSIADAYAAIKALATGRDGSNTHVLVNFADSAEQARDIIARVQETARSFLHVTVGSAGCIPRDEAVAQAVARRVPLLSAPARTPAGRALEQLARRCLNLVPPGCDRPAFFSRLKRPLHRAAA